MPEDDPPLAQRLAQAGLGADWIADDPANDVSPEKVGHRIGPYKLLEKLGEGGFGAVWAAEQREPIKRRVALKIIKLGMDTRQVVGRFEAERQALALMDHPNIAKVLEAGATAEGRPYFVMELVRGVPITTYCRQQKLPIRERVELLASVCQAIQHAHQKGIIHRDIKPSNILVTLHDGVPVPKVIDFGIAKATQQELTDKTVYTRLHQFVGTPAYMSPEQAEMSGLDVDTRSDIYSLGVLLYELLAGEPPFDSASLLATGIDEMRKIIREQEPIRPSTKLRHTDSQTANRDELPIRPTTIDKDLDWIAMKCLEKDRTRRYETANALAEDLRRHLHDEPVSARPPSKLYRWRKLVRRNKAAVAALVAVALALLIGATVSLWQASVAMQAKDETLASLKEQRELSYTTAMSAVGAALQNMNFGRARRLLEVQVPGPGQEDLREFEWYHFQEIVQRDESTLLGYHPTGARDLHAATDGTVLTTNSNRIFGGFTGKLLSWTGKTGSPQELLDLDGVTAVALSKDGKRIAIARGLDIEIRLRSRPSEVETTLEKWHEEAKFQDSVKEMEFCQNGKKLAVSTMHPLTIPGGSIFELIDIATGTVGPLQMDPLGGHVTYMEESRDGRKLALCVSGTHIVIVDLVAGVEETRFRMAEFGGRNVTPLKFIRNDRILATASDSGRIDLWDTDTWKHVRKLEAHVVSATSLSESPNGMWLASAGLDQVIHLWDLESPGGRPFRTLRGHRDEIWGVAFQPDGESLLSCSRDATVRRWFLETWPNKRTRWRLPADTLGARLFHRCLLTADRRGLYHTWLNHAVATTGIPDRFDPPKTMTGRLWVPLEDGVHWLSTPNPPGELEPGLGIPLELHRAPHRKEVGERRFEKVDAFPAISLSKGRYNFHSTKNRLVIRGVIDGKPHWLVWDLQHRRMLHLLPSKITAVSTTALSPDAQVAVLGSLSGDLEVADFREGTTTILQQQPLSWIGALAVMPGNRSVVAGGLPGILVAIDLQTGAVTESVSASLLGIQSMDLSPNGTRLATGDAQGIVKLWALHPLREVTVLGRHAGMVEGVRFNGNGDALVSVDRSEWRLWRAKGR